MTALKRRDRVVIFRLTQDEYDNLLTACTAKGGRNLSDFARSELLAVVGSDPQADRLSVVEQKLSSMESTLKHVTRLLERFANSKN